MLEHTFDITDSEIIFLYGHLLKFYMRWMTVRNFEPNRTVAMNVGAFVWGNYMPPRLIKQYSRYEPQVAKATFSILVELYGEPKVDKNGLPYWEY